MNITLDPDLEKLVQQKVESGVYQDATEMVTEAIRLLVERDDRQGVKSLDQLLAEGQASINRGEVRELTPQLWDDLMEEGRKLSESGAPIQPHISGRY